MNKDGDAVRINSADDISGIEPFISLDEELEQDDRFLEVSQSE